MSTLTSIAIRTVVAVQLLIAAGLLRARQVRAEPERGAMSTTEIVAWTALAVAGAIAIGAILITKGTEAANTVVVQ